MPLPSSINDLSQTAGSNSPSGSEAPSLIDDYLRVYAAYIAQHRDGRGFALEASVASAATCDIGAANSLLVQITGTTGITSFGTTYSGPRLVRFAGALTLTHSASLVLPGAANITTAAGDALIAIPIGNPASGYRVVNYQRAAGLGVLAGPVESSGLTADSSRFVLRLSAGAGPLEQGTPAQVRLLLAPPRGHIAGLTMSTAGASTTMTVAAGEAADSTAAVYLTLAASIGKTTGAWAVGTGNGGLDTGTIANNTWYHFFLIRRPDTGVVDVLFSLSATSPTLPANYTQFRRIGSGRTNGSAQWTRFFQDGDLFQWETPTLDVDVTNPGTAAVTRTLIVPTGVRVAALFQYGAYDPTNGNQVVPHFSDLQTTDGTPSVTAAPLASSTSQGASSIGGMGRIEVMTNTSAQIRSRLTGAVAVSAVLKISTLAWRDSRGRDA